MARPGETGEPATHGVATPVATPVAVATHAEATDAVRKRRQRSAATGTANNTPSSADTVPSANDHGNQCHIDPSNRLDEIVLPRQSKTTTTTTLSSTIVVLGELNTIPSMRKGTTAIKPTLALVGPSMVSSTADPGCLFTNATDDAMPSIGMPATDAGRQAWPVPVPKDRTAAKTVPQDPSCTSCITLVELRSSHPPLALAHTTDAMARPGETGEPATHGVATPVATPVAVATHAEATDAVRKRRQRSAATGTANNTPSSADTVPSANDHGNQCHIDPSNRLDEIVLPRQSKTTTTTTLSSTIVVLGELNTIPSMRKGTTAIKPTLALVGPSMVSSTADPGCLFTNATDGTMTLIGKPATGAGRQLWPRNATASKAGMESSASVVTPLTHDVVLLDSDAETGPTLDIERSDRSSKMADNDLAATAAKDLVGGMPATEAATLGCDISTIRMPIDATIIDEKTPGRAANELSEGGDARRPCIRPNSAAVTKEAKELKETIPMRLTECVNSGNDPPGFVRGVEWSVRDPGGELIHNTTACGMVDSIAPDRDGGNQGIEQFGILTQSNSGRIGIGQAAEVIFKVGEAQDANDRLDPPPKR